MAFCREGYERHDQIHQFFLLGAKQGSSWGESEQESDQGWCRAANTTRGRTERPQPDGTKIVPLQSLAVALGHVWLCNLLSPTAARQKLQGLLKEGNHFPNLPAKPVTRVTCRLRFPALPVVQRWACPWYSFSINVSGLHGFGKIFPVMLSDPLYSEFRRIKSYLLINLWCDGITKQVN